MNTGNNILDNILNIFFLLVITGIGLVFFGWLIKTLWIVLKALFGLAALPFVYLWLALLFILKPVFYLKNLFRLKKEDSIS